MSLCWASTYTPMWSEPAGAAQGGLARRQAPGAVDLGGRAGGPVQPNCVTSLAGSALPYRLQVPATLADLQPTGTRSADPLAR